MGMRYPRRATITALALGAVLLTSQAQVLRKRHPEHTDCPDTHLRLTARHPDGSPAAGLKKQDIYLWFSMGSADIRSIQSGEAQGTATPETNVLIVVPPKIAVPPEAAQPAIADALLKSLRAAPNFQWKVAVLAPDGSVTHFVSPSDEAALRAALTRETPLIAADPATPIPAGRAAAERNAFRQLQMRSGRHVIVELSEPNPDDRTLDLLARDDMAQIYRVADGKEQIEATGGRSAPTIAALFSAIVADAPGSYELMIHPIFSCQPGASYSLRISSFQPNVQLFYPEAIRMAKSE